MIPLEVEAMQVWRWLQWQLPPAVWIEAQRILAPDRPSPQNPQLAQGLATILDPATLPAVRLQLLGNLLSIIQNAGRNQPGGNTPK